MESYNLRTTAYYLALVVGCICHSVVGVQITKVVQTVS